MGSSNVKIKFVSIFLTVALISLLILAGPARAFTLSVIVGESDVYLGEEISFIASLDIAPGERLPVEYLELEIGSFVTCRFKPDGETIFGCSNLNITQIINASSSYGNRTGNFSGMGYGYGYGYDFGYGYGFGDDFWQNLTYNVTLNSSVLGPGVFETRLKVHMFENPIIFEGRGDNITVIDPIVIVNETVSDLCVLEQEEFSVQADITGSVDEVFVFWGMNGNYENVSLGNLGAGTYQYTFNSTQLGPGVLEWQFFARDIGGDYTYGTLNNLTVKHRTSLEVSPASPTGLNGWYVDEPTFILTNPDGNINYSWNGNFFEYSGPFGLEGTPNDGNVTGGIHVLRYWSDVCGEEKQNFTGKFDFTDPLITDISPPDGTGIYNDTSPMIRAFLDEVYQSNSGIDKSSVVLLFDGGAVVANVSDSGELDAIVTYYPGILAEGLHVVNLSVSDYSGRHSNRLWSFSINVSTGFNMTVNEPRDGVYNTKRTLFNLTTTTEVEEISYINYNDSNPREKRLCRNCDEYGEARRKTKNLREGQNELRFIAVDEFDNVREKNVSVFVDSNEPRIRNAMPVRGFTRGEFSVEFDELNPELFLLHYGNNVTGFIIYEVNISSDCVLDRRYECSIWVNLSDYDGEEIEYFFNLTDIAGNNDQSRARDLDVDVTAPVVNSFNSSIEGRKVTFIFNVTEVNFDEVNYVDYFDNDSREGRLCSKLDNGICEKRVYLKDGEHEIDFEILDEAGNFAVWNVSLFTDSKEPRIKKTEPRRGFASGEFFVEFREENPVSLILHYGNVVVGMREHSINISEDCILDGMDYECLTLVNLTDYQGREIGYWLKLTDRVGQSDTSRMRELEVDIVPPVINSLNHSVDGRRVEFIINITEDNFAEVNYVDHSAENPMGRKLCSGLDDGICGKRKSFGIGEHNLTITVLDEAGNFAEGFEYFVIF